MLLTIHLGLDGRTMTRTMRSSVKVFGSGLPPTGTPREVQRLLRSRSQKRRERQRPRTEESFQKIAEAHIENHAVTLESLSHSLCCKLSRTAHLLQAAAAPFAYELEGEDLADEDDKCGWEA